MMMTFSSVISILFDTF